MLVSDDFKKSYSFFVLISFLVRFVFCIDAFSFHGLYPSSFIVILMELTIPFFLMSSLLIVLYWHEIMIDSSLKVSPFITKLRIPFYVLSGVVLAVHAIRMVLMGLNIARAAMSLFTGKSLCSNTYFCINFVDSAILHDNFCWLDNLLYRRRH